MSKNNNKGNLKDKITKNIRKDILLKKYTGEERLYEEELAKKLGVSRGTIRTALQILIREGLVEENNGKKTVVPFTNKTIEDIYKLRLYLEKKAIDIIINSSDIKYKPLLELFSQIEYKDIPANKKNNEENIDIYYESDINFHTIIIAISNNRAILQAWETISSIIYTLLRINATEDYRRQYVSEFYQKHKKIVDLLITKDKKCLEEIEKHIVDAREISLGLINK